MKKLLLAMVASMLLAGCTPRIEIAASKEPITINMNVKIEHEIHIKVDKDVENLLKSRQQGRVGETLNGYLAPLRQDKETLALVKQINAARSESYQQLADDNNLPVDEVAKMAGQKLVARAQPGEYVQGLNGQWLRK